MTSDRIYQVRVLSIRKDIDNLFTVAFGAELLEYPDHIPEHDRKHGRALIDLSAHTGGHIYVDKGAKLEVTVRPHLGSDFRVFYEAIRIRPIEKQTEGE